MVTPALAQKKVKTPDEIYGQLFVDVQMAHIFPDNKTFVDCVPKRDPALIVKDYLKMKSNPAVRFSLKMFVEENFEIPKAPQLNYVTQEKNVESHIQNLWSVLKREKDVSAKGSSLLPLPNPYIVPGGRFREIYYWDSYFTMLGLRESGETKVIEDMVKNFAYLINTYGHIPNGNRSYYLSRSQPPFFSHMVELLAQIKGPSVLKTYAPILEKEYNYWMAGATKLKNGEAVLRVVKLDDGTVLNRYYDERSIPRQESYSKDVATADTAVNNFIMVALFRDAAHQKQATDEYRKKVYNHLFADEENISTIHTSDFIPVDLNSLLYHLESLLSQAYRSMGNTKKGKAFQYAADKRKTAIDKYMWSRDKSWFMDYDYVNKTLSNSPTLAGMVPFFTQVAPKARIESAKAILEKDFLKPGGVVTTLHNTGEQWDAPNGWAPLQWMTIEGLNKYGDNSLATEIASRWIQLNEKVFQNTGKLMEKYNVVNTDLEAGGGEYPSQDGFGWTNGVLLALKKKYSSSLRGF